VPTLHATELFKSGDSITYCMCDLTSLINIAGNKDSADCYANEGVHAGDDP